ncbi:MAG: IgGFc-binding protein [Deltaproteobacteria bacterium]|nr:IgGFc-binding protein [Deltaproteobacteria bacterium]
MMRLSQRALIAALLCALVATCGPDGRNNPEGCFGICSALGYQKCNADGTYEPPVSCGPGQVCDPQAGCVVCPPAGLYCGGVTNNDVYQCNADGTGGTVVMTCAEDSVCSNGTCKTPCEAAEDNPSNLGCDFWAVDLDNEAFNLLGTSNDAAAQQFSVVAANNNDYPVTITVTKNTARVGEPVSEMAIVQMAIPPRTASRIDLPQREVDGAMGQNGAYTRNSGSGTFVSPHAYHVVATGPVVVYQFNPIVQQYSNDASTLIPRHAIGSDYVVIGFDTANPCAIEGMMIESIPDHGAVTIVAAEDDTTVTVTTTHPIMASGGDSGLALAETAKGGTLTMKLSRYMVANLESKMASGSFGDCMTALNNGQTGDFTGTIVHADKPIVVFTSHERGIGFGGAQNIEYPPDWDMDTDRICCTDHLEEQLLPTTALGKEFAVARSPIRSTDTTGWIEPDVVRVVATVDGTVVTTNLAAPYNSFTLNAREQKTFGATVGFTISATNAIEVAQYLVPQQFVKSGNIGDPSQLLVPAAEQHRKDYVFLVPATFTKNYIVLAKPVGSAIVLDGVPLNGVEFGCTTAMIGMVAGVQYEQQTCELQAGRHTVSSEMPFGLAVYGYYNVGSYAFVGGSDVKIINPIF